MKSLYIVVTYIFLFQLQSFAQSFTSMNLNLDNGEALKEDVFGLNGALMFHHAIDLDDHTIPTNVLDAIDDLGNGILRFPGGAISDDFHFNFLGYGGIKEEHEAFDHARKCNTANGETYCYKEDLTAIRNYTYDYIDVARYLYDKRKQPVKTLYVLNFLSHSAYGQDQFLELDAVNQDSDLNQLVSDGRIDEEIKDGIIQNLDALRLLLNESTVEVVGVEVGNELYFHETFTGVVYKTSSNADVDMLREQFDPRIPKIKALFACYQRLIDKIDPSLKTAIPISKVNHNGVAGNFDIIWNEAVRDHFLNYADGIIIHDYIIRTSGLHNISNPTTVEGGNANRMNTNLELMYEQYIRVQDKTLENEKFFNLKSQNKETWVTEYNVKNNPSQWIGKWRNTFLHGAYMLEHGLNFYDVSSQTNLTKIISHNLLGGETSHRYANISVFKEEDNGQMELSLRKRVQYYTSQMLLELNKYAIKKITGPVKPTSIDEFLFHSKYYYAQNDTEESVFIFFVNTSSQEAIFNSNNVNIQKGGNSLGIKNASIVYMSAPHLYSSNGTTEFMSEDTPDEVLKTETTLSLKTDYSIPKYAYGYIKLNVACTDQSHTVMDSSCNVSDTGTVVKTEVGSSGCDSIVTVITTLKNPENCTTTGIRENLAHNFYVYPNPTKAFVTFELRSNQFLKEKRIILYDQLGKEVTEHLWEAYANSKTFSIEYLAKGIYFYTIKSSELNGGELITGKIIVN